MRTQVKCALLLICCLGTGLVNAQRRPGVKDVLPKVNVPEEIMNLQQQLQKVMVFIDPVTGEMRGPEGEHQALVGLQKVPTAAPNGVTAEAPIDLPEGGFALKLDPSTIDFMTATTDPDGSISYAHAKASEVLKGGHHED